MSSRIRIAVLSFTGLVLFGAIALVLTLVITSIVIGGPINFPGQPEIADAGIPAAASVGS